MYNFYNNGSKNQRRSILDTGIGVTSTNRVSFLSKYTTFIHAVLIVGLVLLIGYEVSTFINHEIAISLTPAFGK